MKWPWSKKTLNKRGTCSGTQVDMQKVTLPDGFFEEQPYNKRGTCSGNQANMKHVYEFSDRFMEAHRAIAKLNEQTLK